MKGKHAYKIKYTNLIKHNNITYRNISKIFSDSAHPSLENKIHTILNNTIFYIL